MTAPTGADFSVVEAEKLRRGRAIKIRREAHGIRSLRQFQEVAGIDRATLGKIEQGIGTPEMTARAEALLDRLDTERGVDTRTPASVPDGTAPLLALDPDGDLIEFDITGPRTEWHVVVRGPADIADQLRHQAAELLKDLHPEG